jgi:hypothetical protein
MRDANLGKITYFKLRLSRSREAIDVFIDATHLKLLRVRKLLERRIVCSRIGPQVQTDTDLQREA